MVRHCVALPGIFLFFLLLNHLQLSLLPLVTLTDLILEIQKLFGESTAGGLEFHFREVKATGKAQQEAVDRGESPTRVPVGAENRWKKVKEANAAAKNEVLDGKAKAMTPDGKAKKAGLSTPTTNRKRAINTKAATTGGRIRKRQALDDEQGRAAMELDDEDSPDDNYNELDLDTPSKPRPRSARNPAYTVNNSTTNSETDTPLPTPRPYAQRQAEAQARARVEYPEYQYQAEFSGDRQQIGYAPQLAPGQFAPYTTHGAPMPQAPVHMPPQQHHNIFGGEDAAWSFDVASSPSYCQPPLAATSGDDDLVEISAHQFTPNADGVHHQQAHQLPQEAIKKDPFESDAGNASDFLDLTSVSSPKKQGWGNTSRQVPYTYQDTQGFGTSYPHENDDAYGDGEV